MNSLHYCGFVLLCFVSIVGCGGRQNEVLVAPDVTPEVQQKTYDDYDKQNAESQKNYQ